MVIFYTWAIPHKITSIYTCRLFSFEIWEKFFRKGDDAKVICCIYTFAWHFIKFSQAYDDKKLFYHFLKILSDILATSKKTQGKKIAYLFLLPTYSDAKLKIRHEC